MFECVNVIILSQYRGTTVICSFCTPFNRGACFQPSMPAFVLTNTKRNRWIKSFNYSCGGNAVTVCACDTILLALYEGREVVATVTAVGAWRKWEGDAGSKRSVEEGEDEQKSGGRRRVWLYNYT